MKLLSKTGNQLKAVGYKKAIDQMRLPGTRLIKTYYGSGGCVHYVVPGGYIEPDVAEKIKNHPQVTAGQDGLWPSHPQTWRILSPHELQALKIAEESERVLPSQCATDSVTP
jgi:hypothetical protein